MNSSRIQTRHRPRRHAVAGIALGLACAFACLPAVILPVHAQSTQRIAAIVNDDIISDYDLRARTDLIILSSQLPNTREARERLESQVLRTLIDDRLRLQESRRQKITVAEQEIESAVQTIAERNQMTPANLYALLEKYQIDRGTLRLQIEADLAWRKLISNQVRATVTISDDAVDDAIQRIEANKGKPEHLVSEIFISMQAGKSAAETRELVDRLRQQITQGANFAELARSFSQSASAATGGNLGWVREDQLDSVLIDAIQKMQPGELSPPIQGIDGFYILALRNRRISQGLSAADATVTLQQVFVPLAGAPADQKIPVAERIAAEAKTCGDMEATGKRLGSPQSGRLSNVKLSSLPPAIRDAVAPLKDGQTSTPLQVGDGIMVLMICERSGDVDTEMRGRVRAMLTGERGELIARRQLRDLYRSAFVDVRK